MTQNRILKAFKNDGTECGIEEGDYCQLELLGTKALAIGGVALVSTQSLPTILALKWYLGADGYPVGYPARRKMHHVLRDAPPGHVVDHINRDRLDNRLENLRVCTHKQNSYNTSRRGPGFKGVKKSKDGWCATITKDGRRHVIRDIPTERDAAKIYDLMAGELFGQYAGKNFAE